MLLGLVCCPADKVRVYHRERRDLCHEHKLTDAYEVKWTQVRPGKQALYLAWVDWFLAKTDVSFRAVVLPNKKELYQRLPDESRDMLYYRLYGQLLRSAVLDTEGRYRVFMDQKDTRGGKKVEELQKLLRAQSGDDAGESILGLQQAQSHEIRLLQLADLLLGAVGYARTREAGTDSMAKRALIARLEDGIGGALSSDTQAFSDKLTVGTCHDVDSLLL